MGAALRPGASVAGRYRIVGILEEGQMSIVAHARRESDGLDVAIKVLHPDLANVPELVERFRREARALTRLCSEHVVRVLEVVEAAGLPAMVTEFLHGEDLDRVLDAEGPLAIGDAVSAVHQACDAIAEAHALGIIHRDLKPANLFRTEGGHIKVIDFGIAKSPNADDEPSLTGTGSAMGSPLYMAPEQLRCERLDARVDVWALGATLYELLAGITPFEAEVPAMVLAGILTHAPHPLRAEREDVSEELERVILRCLAKDPRDRFASVTALQEALEDHLASL